jgi:hypothetical protein
MQFENKTPFRVKELAQVQRQWSSLLQALEGHTKSVVAVAFLPDGKKRAPVRRTYSEVVDRRAR